MLLQTYPLKNKASHGGWLNTTFYGMDADKNWNVSENPTENYHQFTPPPPFKTTNLHVCFQSNPSSPLLCFTIIYLFFPFFFFIFIWWLSDQLRVMGKSCHFLKCRELTRIHTHEIPLWGLCPKNHLQMYYWFTVCITSKQYSLIFYPSFTYWKVGFCGLGAKTTTHSHWLKFSA